MNVLTSVDSTEASPQRSDVNTSSADTVSIFELTLDRNNSMSSSLDFNQNNETLSLFDALNSEDTEVSIPSPSYSSLSDRSDISQNITENGSNDSDTSRSDWSSDTIPPYVEYIPDETDIQSNEPVTLPSCSKTLVEHIQPMSKFLDENLNTSDEQDSCIKEKNECDQENKILGRHECGNGAGSLNFILKIHYKTESNVEEMTEVKIVGPNGNVKEIKKGNECGWNINMEQIFQQFKNEELELEKKDDGQSNCEANPNVKKESKDSKKNPKKSNC